MLPGTAFSLHATYCPQVKRCMGPAIRHPDGLFRCMICLSEK